MPADSPMTVPMPELQPIHRLLRRARRCLRGSWGTTGLGLTCGTAGALILLAVTVDLLMPLSEGRRAAALGLFAVPTAYVFLVGVVLPLLRRLGAVEMARRIERLIPGMHNRLVSCVDMADHPDHASRVSPAFFRRLVKESVERIDKVSPHQVVDWSAVRSALLFAVGGSVLPTLLWLAFPSRVPTALERIFRPFADIPPISSVRYRIEPGTTKILAGTDLRIVAHIEAGDPEELTVVFDSPEGSIARIERPMSKQADGTWTTLFQSPFPVGYSETFTYRVVGGGTWSTRASVTILPRPEIRSLTSVVRYPPYLAIPEPQTKPVAQEEISGPIGSTIDVKITPAAPAVRGELRLLREVEEIQRTERPKQRIWFDGALPEGARTDGNWVWAASNEPTTPTGRKAHIQGSGDSGRYRRGFDIPRGATFPIRAGDVLFVDLLIDPQRPPESIYLRWIDADGKQEAGAIWERTPTGSLANEARWIMGELPKVGEWVRVEVPAESVGLVGKSLRGMIFEQVGGVVRYGAVGAGEPSKRSRRERRVVQVIPLVGGADGITWTGSFPLTENGWFTVQLWNELDIPSEPSKPTPFRADLDSAPRIGLKPDDPIATADKLGTIVKPGNLLLRPRQELPTERQGNWGQVPLEVDLVDDYGLAEAWLAVAKPGEAFRRELLLKDYGAPNPLRAESLSSLVNLRRFMAGTPGEVLRYRVEVRDRATPDVLARRTRPGETPDAWTVGKEYTITVSTADTEDKRLDRLEQSEDAFRKKLEDLIARQKQVDAALRVVSVKAQPIVEKVRSAEDARDQELLALLANDPTKALPNDPSRPDPKKLPTPPVKLDPTTTKEVAELRAELAQLAQQQADARTQAEALGRELQGIVAEAQRSPLLNKEIGHELAQADRLFQSGAVEPLRDLQQMLEQAAAPNALPKSAPIQGKSERLLDELEALKNRLGAVGEAQRRLREAQSAEEVQRTLDELRKSNSPEETLRNARADEEQLSDLLEALKAMQDEFRKLKGTEEMLKERTGKAPDADLAPIEKEQEFLEDVLGKKFDDLRKLQSGKQRPRKRTPKLPTDPANPDPKSETVPPAEQDSDPETDSSKKDDPAGHPNAEQPMDEPKDENFHPALGTPQKLDPRFQDKQRPGKKRDKAPTPSELRADLLEREDGQLQNLERALQSLNVDQAALQQMLNQLRDGRQETRSAQQQQQQQQGNARNQAPSDAVQEAIRKLQQMMQSQGMQAAQAMAQRAKQMQGQSDSQGQGRSTQGNRPNLAGQSSQGPGKVDPFAPADPSRIARMRLQEVQREEQQQGKKPVAPTGYQPFITD